MKIKLTRTLVGPSKEWVLDIERKDRATRRDKERWAIEEASRLKMALEAVKTDPDNAAEIAEEALN